MHKMEAKRYSVLLFVVGSMVLVHSCVVPFTPPEVNADESYLVVDGFLNAGQDTSRFELRRSQNINQIVSPVIERGALLTIEEESGGHFALTEKGAGHYILPPVQLDRGSKYRLLIATSNGKEYISEYVPVTITPAIDSITYRLNPENTAMVFYVNTHDDQSRTQFYRWKFEETWEYEAAYVSNLELEGEDIIARKEQINRCWADRRSGSILLGTTIKLSNDIIRDQPLNVVPISTNKLSRKYSILIRQYGLSRPAFEYWTSLAKTTQITGSLFDAKPSQVTGNITSTGDKKDLVFGYFSVATEETKRIFISPRLGNYARCIAPDTIPIACYPGEVCAKMAPGLLLNYYGFRSEFVLVAPASCADCRLEGGTTVRPAFWDN